MALFGASQIFRDRRPGARITHSTPSTSRSPSTRSPSTRSPSASRRRRRLKRSCHFARHCFRIVARREPLGGWGAPRFLVLRGGQDWSARVPAAAKPEENDVVHPDFQPSYRSPESARHIVLPRETAVCEPHAHAAALPSGGAGRHPPQCAQICRRQARVKYSKAHKAASEAGAARNSAFATSGGEFQQALSPMTRPPTCTELRNGASRRAHALSMRNQMDVLTDVSPPHWLRLMGREVIVAGCGGWNRSLRKSVPRAFPQGARPRIVVSDSRRSIGTSQQRQLAGLREGCDPHDAQEIGGQLGFFKR